MHNEKYAKTDLKTAKIATPIEFVVFLGYYVEKIGGTSYEQENRVYKKDDDGIELYCSSFCGADCEFSMCMDFSSACISGGSQKVQQVKQKIEVKW